MKKLKYKGKIYVATDLPPHSGFFLYDFPRQDVSRNFVINKLEFMAKELVNLAKEAGAKELPKSVSEMADWLKKKALENAR